jgi:hypothetical protein
MTRYALICKNCHFHNGMALKEEFEYVGKSIMLAFIPLLFHLLNYYLLTKAFRCAYCLFYNEARKSKLRGSKPEVKRSIQMNTTEDAANNSYGSNSLSSSSLDDLSNDPISEAVSEPAKRTTNGNSNHTADTTTETLRNRLKLNKTTANVEVKRRHGSLNSDDNILRHSSIKESLDKISKPSFSVGKIDNIGRSSRNSLNKYNDDDDYDDDLMDIDDKENYTIKKDK